MNIDVVSLPLIGAFIGYFTNYVAIKMLFHPKKAYYIKGYRIPFTPGLIPKQKDELVEKISDVVANKVINKRELTRFVYSKKNREFLYTYTQDILDGLLKKRLSAVNLPYKRIEGIVYGWLDGYLDGFIKSKIDNLDLNIDYLAYNALGAIDKTRRIGEYLPDETRQRIDTSLRGLLERFLGELSCQLNDYDTKQLIRKKLSEALEEYADESNILTASFVAMIAPLIEDNDRVVDVIVEKLEGFLSDKQVKEKVYASMSKAVKVELLGLRLDEFVLRFTSKDFEQLRVELSKRIASLTHTLNIKEVVYRAIVGSIDKRSTARRLVALLRLYLRRYSFYDLLRFVRPDLEKRLNRFIVNNLLVILKRQSDRIFDFDIKENAMSKLKKLDVGQIEDIILSISRDQFSHINLFGGILGFIIGLIEVIIR
ncbi:DUF445 family protein [Hippea sp. KM1]|uniref:DUF445 family protein n=1 Tax=Hippea sp. KM1 TaxID=944481 RepID=UPI00046D1313|nr:DUF445 family protein [Hippea sp. KM1]